jgi:EAL domain-containing protein (putative c-di-GMP-specific phosphodiesterase class I)
VFGLQPPGLFLPVSEQTGQILEIDAWALRHAAALAKRLEAGRLEAGRLNGECQPPPHPPLAISVNLSAPRLRHPGLAGLLENILRETGADPATLKLEIAEPVLAEAMARDAAGMIAELRRLRALGFGIVIDDFGAGAASLSNLHRLPVTDIKIDPGFIRDCADSPYHQLVIGAFVAIGGALGIDVTAKGVARDAQLRGLEKLGVRRAQGFLFGAPIDADAFSAQAFAAEAGEARMGPPLFFPRADGIAAPGT